MAKRLLPALVTLALTAVMILADRPGSVSAHAIMLRAAPSDGAVLSTPPRRMVVWFSEAIILRLSHIDLVDENGRRIPVAGLQAADGHGNATDPSTVVVNLPRLEPNAYHLFWRVVSADDLHTSTGSIVFGVQRAVPAVATPDVPAPSAIEIMLRWLNFIAIAGLLGPLALSLTAISTVRAPAVVPVQRRLLRVIVWSGVLALLVGGALLVATTTTVGAWWQILNGTGYGMRWLLRQGALLAIVAITVWALRGRSFEAMSPWLHPERVPDKSRLLLVAITPLALSIVVLHALNSHAAGLRTGAFVATLADVAHLLAACFWVGGLVALAVAIAPLMGRGGDEAALARTVLRRFGILAAASLAMLLATGLYASGQQVASLDALLLTLYGHALLLKICLGLCTGLIGLLHAATFHPRVADAVGHLLRRPAGWMPPGDRHVRRTVILEAAGGTGILLLTALMGATQPARGPRFDPPPAPITAPASITTPLADLLATLSVKPDRPGHNIVLLGIFNTRRPAPAPIVRVTVRFQALSSRHATTVIATPLGGGRYQATGASLNVAGAWRISVTVDRAGLRPATVTVPWTVLPLASPAAPPPVVFSNRPLAPILTAASMAVAVICAGIVLLLCLRRAWPLQIPAPRITAINRYTRQPRRG